MANTSLISADVVSRKELAKLFGENPAVAIVVTIGIPLALDFFEKVISKVIDNDYRVSVKWNEGFVLEKCPLQEETA